MDDAVAYFLDLRVRVRSNPAARAIVDRCLSLITRATHADDETLMELQREVEALADEPALRFGAPKTVRTH